MNQGRQSEKQELGVPDSNVAQVMALLRGARNEVLNRQTSARIELFSPTT